MDVPIPPYPLLSGHAPILHHNIINYKGNMMEDDQIYGDPDDAGWDEAAEGL